MRQWFRPSARAVGLVVAPLALWLMLPILPASAMSGLASESEPDGAWRSTVIIGVFSAAATVAALLLLRRRSGDE